MTTVRRGGYTVSSDPADQWLVCEHPERPIDGDAQWHIFGRCRGCIIAMEARIARGEEQRVMVARLVLEPTLDDDA